MSSALHRHTPTLTVIDPRGLAVRDVAWHRNDAATAAEPRITHHRFDAAGRPVQHQDPRFFAQGEAGRNNLSAVFSLSGRVLASDSVDAGWRVELVGEDGLGQDSWDSRGCHAEVEYDALRRPTAIFENEGCVERFSYGAADADADHNLCNRCLRHDDPAGTRHFLSYDLNGLMQQERQHFLIALDPPDWPNANSDRDALLEPGEGLATQRCYLASGELFEQIDAKGNCLQQHYSVAGRLARSELQPAGLSTVHTLVSEIRYNAFAQVERQAAGNGLETLTEYDPASGYLMRLQCHREATKLQDLHYDYDPVGNVIRHEDWSIDTLYHANRRIEPVNTYAYDTLYQLTEATGRERLGAGNGPDLPELIGHPVDPGLIGAYTRRYDYDSAGNLLFMQHNGQNNQQHSLRMAVSDISNKALPWREGLDTEQIEDAFDANGNVRELQTGQPLEWDARNQLQRVATVKRAQGDDDSERYIYGGGGQRLRKYTTQLAHGVNHVAETRYLPGLELHTNSATGNNWQVITLEAGRNNIRLLHWENSPPEGMPNDPLYYTFDNHLGSITLETDAAGLLCSREEYYPFGATALLAARNALEVSFKTRRYSGKERDATGLYYYGLRYLAPWLHRWLNPDPAGAVDGLNLFGFVGNNPATRVDLDGRVGSDVEEEQTDFTFQNVAAFLLTASLDPNMVISVPAPIPGPSTQLTMSENFSLPAAPPSPALSDISISSSLRFPEDLHELDLPEPEAPTGPLPGFSYRIGSDPHEYHVPATRSTTQPGAMLPPRRFLCDYPGCNRNFPYRKYLTEHSRTHSRERPYLCTACGKSFSQQSNLTRHTRTHIGEKSFVCSHSGCGKSFSQQTNLTLHSRTHTGERPYLCNAPGCGLGFSQKQNLTVHERTHTGETPYACTADGCGRQFTQKTNLNKHLITHTGQRPYVCRAPGCRKSYSDPSHLSRHRKTHT